MTWKHDGNGIYHRPCPTCHGRGFEQINRHRSDCSCPWNNCEDVEHPANSPREGIAYKLVRCNRCGLVWLVYYECSDDSWDVPGPDLVGTTIPDIDWRPTGKEATR